MAEPDYWLAVLKEIIDFEYDEKGIIRLNDESNQLNKIFGSIANKNKK